jgi:hypothetical protein
MRFIGIIGAVAVLLLITGCGDDETPPGEAEAANEAAIEEADAEAVSEDEVAATLDRELGAQPNEYGTGLDYDAPGATDSCTIIVILTTPEEVELYRGDPPDPGQPIVTNPDGSVGVKVTSTDQDQAACLRAAEGALKGL